MAEILLNNENIIKEKRTREMLIREKLKREMFIKEKLIKEKDWIKFKIF